MKGYLGRLQQRFEALNGRERLLVALACWLLLLFALDTVLVAPLRSKGAVLGKAIAAKEGEAAGLEAELSGLRARQAQDPDAETKKRIAEMEGRIAAIDASLQAARGRIVPPERMAALLEQVLRRNTRLALVSLRSLPPETLLAEDKPAEKKEGGDGTETAAAQGMLYRQGMELTLAGGYLDMLDYVAQLEQLPWKMYWGRLDLKVEEHPRATLRLRVYTLSMDKAWLSI
jgi:MSHA biogenesis protein MshJ